MPERLWVFLKTRIKPILTRVEDKKRTASGIEEIDFNRRIYARMSTLEAKANMLLYGAPRNDKFIVTQLQNPSLGTDKIASEYFRKEESDTRIIRRQIIGRNFSRITSAYLKKNRIPIKRILHLSAENSPDLTLLKTKLPHLRESVAVSPHETFPDEVEEKIVSTPLTALKVLSAQKFDLISCIGVFETLTPREQVELLILAVTLLNAGGALYLQVPNLRNPDIFFDEFWKNPDCLKPYSITMVEKILTSQTGGAYTKFLVRDSKDPKVFSGVSKKEESQAKQVVFLCLKPG